MRNPRYKLTAVEEQPLSQRGRGRRPQSVIAPKLDLSSIPLAGLVALAPRHMAFRDGIPVSKCLAPSTGAEHVTQQTHLSDLIEFP